MYIYIYVCMYIYIACPLRGRPCVTVTVSFTALDALRAASESSMHSLFLSKQMLCQEKQVTHTTTRPCDWQHRFVG